MRRMLCACIVGIGLMALCQTAPAQVYVPGQYRQDGLYIRPHFTRSDAQIDDAWFKGLATPVTAGKDDELPSSPDEPRKAKAGAGAGR